MAARETRTLTSREETQFRNHLATCDRCRQADTTGSDEDEWRWLARVPIDQLGDDRGVVLPTIDPGVFEVSNELATGGMGRVLVGRDRRLGRDVAIKELLDPTLHARFEREVLITSRLQHPAIVPIYEAGMWPDGTAFYTMRLVSGGTLQVAIAGAKLLPQRLALLHHVVAVTEAVAYAHAHRIIHRDLKPTNVLVGELGETVVIDWGLAKELDRREVLVDGFTLDGSAGLTRVGAVMGTPGFMAPEQARGESIDERADVYALGSILYALLAGVPPYADLDSPEELVQVSATRPPRSIDELAPEAPADLRAIVNRAMARDPSERYPTAREMAEQLRRFEAGQLLSRQYTARELIRRWLKRHRTAVAVGVSAAALVIAIGIIAIVNVARSHTAERIARQAAEHAREGTEASFAALLEEQGRSATLAGDLERGLVYLSEALHHGRDTTTLRYLLAVATRARALLRAEIRPLPGFVEDVAFSPDGKLATIEDSGRFAVWNQAALVRFHALGGKVELASFGPGTTSLAVVGVDHALAMWDVATGTRRWQLANLGGEDVGSSVRFAPTGSRLIFMRKDASRAVVLDVATGQTLATLEVAGTMNEVAFSPEGGFVAASGSDGQIQIWDATTYIVHASWTVPKARNLTFIDEGHLLTTTANEASLWDLDSHLVRVVSHEDDLIQVAVDPHGRQFATADARGSVRIWTFAGQDVATSHHARTKLRDLKFSPDGRTLVGAATDELLVWDAASLDLLGTIAVDGLGIAWNADSTLFAASTTANYARVWAVANRSASFRSEAIERAGDHLITQDRDTAVIRTLAGAEVVRFTTAHKTAWQASLDGSRGLAASEGTLRIVELPSGRTVGSLETVDKMEEAEMSLNGQRIVQLDFTARGSRLRVADGSGRSIVARSFPSAGPVSEAISPDGRSLAVLHAKQPWSIWTTDTLAPRIVALEGSLGAAEAAFDPTGRNLVVYDRATSKDPTNRTVTIYDATTGAVLSQLSTVGYAQRVRFSADGNLLAFQTEEGAVEVYAIGAPRLLTLVERTAERAFALTSDGARLATGGSDGSIRIWDSATGRLLDVLRGHHQQITALSFSALGTQLFAQSKDQTASIWQVGLDQRSDSEIRRLAENSGWKLVDGALVPGP